jgi:hypothetical protein
MATKADYAKAILDALGNPVSGSVVENLDLIVDAAFGVENPTKETRVVEVSEKR